MRLSCMKKIYNLDLRGYDLTAYKHNPIVVYEFDWNSPIIGKATIASDRLSVEVEFVDEAIYKFGGKTSEMPLKRAEAYLADTKVLIGLSLVVPK